MNFSPQGEIGFKNGDVVGVGGIVVSIVAFHKNGDASWQGCRPLQPTGSEEQVLPPIPAPTPSPTPPA